MKNGYWCCKIDFGKRNKCRIIVLVISFFEFLISDFLYLKCYLSMKNKYKMK